MKKRILTILSLVLIGTLVIQNNGLNFLNRNAYAVGDLTVNWGIGVGNVGPIFSVNNIAPGNSETRSVNVANGATSPRQVGVRGILTNDTGNMKSVMNVEIREGITTLYNQTLEQFFLDSAGPDGIPLSTLGNGVNTDYEIIVTFDSSAGNEFQNKSITFDIQIGIALDLPAQCDLISFPNSPIYGTSGNDNINGTSKNDVIVTFEGDDKVKGGGGHDCIVTMSGIDTVDGQTGNDVIDLGSEDDSANPSSGNDVIIAGSGNDKVDGGSDDDQIFGGSGNDKLTGGSGNDLVLGENDNDTLEGGSGADNLVGGSGVDSAKGGSGIDTCEAESENTCEL